MLYYSLNHQSPKVNFKEATIRGQAPDKGLYFPEKIPLVTKDFINDISKFTNEEIAFKIIKPYVGDTISDADLKRIVADTINFNIPLVAISENISSLELFHGPTLAFKDIGARFMSRCLGHFLKNNNKKVTVLVATSGDTGGAVANGFYNVEGIEVVVLYPSKKISAVQEAQIATLGKNIKAIEIDGNFDDCQSLVKQAFTDVELNNKLYLTSANSINVARWLPQQFYYFFAYKQWIDKENSPVVAVPSGNFGNICAGILAAKSGLPIKHFIAACNANNVVTNYLLTETYKLKPAIATISNAMDVGDPSNFVRIMEIFEKKFSTLKENLSSYSVSDELTIDVIKKVYTQYHYLLDPHGAVAYQALEAYLMGQPQQKGFILETAHPVKFNDTITSILKRNVLASTEAFLTLNSNKQSIFMRNSYDVFKKYLLSV